MSFHTVVKVEALSETEVPCLSSTIAWTFTEQGKNVTAKPTE